MAMIKKTLATVPYYWTKEELLAFYAEASTSSFDVIYLGETVCSKRHHLRFVDWMQLARDLRDAGKEVVLSSLTLLESSADWRQLEKLCSNDQFTVEANDLGAAQLCSERGQKFVCGSGVNVYNAATVNTLSQLGCVRCVLPFDLSQTQLQSLIEQSADAKVSFELQVFGPLALAYSARCFTARHHDLPKDDCQFRCGDHLSGLTVYSREQQRFLRLNGIQTQGSEWLDLREQIPVITAMGVSHLRYVPTAPDCLSQLADNAMFENVCNGFWFGGAGMEKRA